MGWQSGAGLGRFEQGNTELYCLREYVLEQSTLGRVDPVPFEMKDDHMGLGRWTMEVNNYRESIKLPVSVGMVFYYVAAVGTGTRCN